MRNLRRLLPVVFGGGAVSPLLTGLISYWKMDEASGNRLDSVGGNTMVDPTGWTAAAGIIGNCINGTATTTGFACASNAALQTGDIDFTVSAWLNIGDKSANRMAVGKTLDWGVDAATLEYVIGYLASGDRFWCAFRSVAGGLGTITVTNGGSPTIGAWYHVLFEHDSVLNKVNVTVNNTTTDSADWTTGITVNNSVMCIGSAGNVGTDRRWYGAIDEVGFWKRKLTAAEKTTLYQGGIGKAYPFDLVGTDVFVIAGQSNASGRGTNNQVYSASKNCYILGNDYVIKNMVDPTDSNTGQVDAVSSDAAAAGSVWPLVASQIVTATNRRALFVPCALGATSITDWLPGVDHQDRATLYGSMVYRALQVQAAGTLRAVVWWLGETDAIADMAQAVYNGHLDTLAAAVMADLGVPLIACKFQNCSGIADASEAKINDAIAEAWADNPNTRTGPDLSGIASDDAYHLTGDANLSTAAGLWVTAIRAALGW